MSDSINFGKKFEEFKITTLGDDRWMEMKPPSSLDWYGNAFDFNSDDKVNHPSHYTKGKQEAIDTISDAIQDAPNPTAGFLQGQVLKYLLRLWLKKDCKEDAMKARWYLNKLIDSL